MRTHLLVLTAQLNHDWLRGLFQRQGHGLSVLIASSEAEMRDKISGLPRPLRLVSILSTAILSAEFLVDLGEPAYNFHPGPPEYPGSCPEVFALYEGAASYGITVHVMVPQVDAGPIIGVERFAIPPGYSRMELGRLTWAKLLAFVEQFAPALVHNRYPLPEISENWSPRRRSGRAFTKLADLPADISADELDRRVRAMDDGTGLLTMRVHGHLFRLVP